jgi:hypothetical protein
MLRRHPVRKVLGFLALALAGSACTTTHSSVGEEEPKGVFGASERLAELQPAEIAVAPIRDQTDAQRVPLEVVRTAFVESLVERRYSPLATRYVDANWLEAAFKGTPLPDAVLVVAVTAWDPNHLYSTGKVTLVADVSLFEGGDTTGHVLWQRSFQGEVDMGPTPGKAPAPGEDLIPRAVRKLAQEALAALPMRDPALAHAAPAGR